MAWELIGGVVSSYRSFTFDFSKYRYKFTKNTDTGITIFKEAFGHPNNRLGIIRLDGNDGQEVVVEPGTSIAAQLSGTVRLSHASGIYTVNVYRELLSRPEINVNGQSREVDTISCKINGQIREVMKMWAKVDGQLREL